MLVKIVLLKIYIDFIFVILYRKYLRQVYNGIIIGIGYFIRARFFEDDLDMR